ncbi:MAG: cytidyltransferase [Elusimicrobia bacterium]|nr:MAG: cytidyltransferase [Elusimicrobiota bacterium]
MVRTSKRVNGKVLSLEDLAARSAAAKKNGKRVVHCHGVFDLLHIGHIKHFESARRLGDMLVVTLTPDGFVNKGPGRPMFSDDLRAKAIAALSCVDYVAVNKWPSAEKTIALVRPSIYAKGPDYRDQRKDRTGGIVREEAAVRKVRGRIEYTKDATYSSSKLINWQLSPFPEDVQKYLLSFAKRHSADDVIAGLETLRKMKVLVVGEAIIDEYQYCRAIGKSSKEPMLAVKHLSTEKFAGGVLAVANHVANFCDKVGLVTSLGSINSHESFVRKTLAKNVKPILVMRPDAPTIVKRRFVENYFFTKMLTVYEMDEAPGPAAYVKKLHAALKREVQRYDVVIVVDFGHGLLDKKAIRIVTRHSKFLAVNTQSNAGNIGYHTVSRYPRADYFCVAENEIRLETRDRVGDVRKMTRAVAKKLKARNFTVTRGKSGSLCYSREEGLSEVPALAGQVVDRMGAGDAFFAVTSLCVAAGMPSEVVGFVGNAVGARAVATVGHRSFIERVPLYKHIEVLLK